MYFLTTFYHSFDCLYYSHVTLQYTYITLFVHRESDIYLNRRLAIKQDTLETERAQSPCCPRHLPQKYSERNLQSLKVTGTSSTVEFKLSFRFQRNKLRRIAGGRRKDVARGCGERERARGRERETKNTSCRSP